MCEMFPQETITCYARGAGRGRPVQSGNVVGGYVVGLVSQCVDSAWDGVWVCGGTGLMVRGYVVEMVS